MARYVAIVDGKRGAFGIVIPDLPGCTSGGRTIEAALGNAAEAVTLWVEDARTDGETIPKPRSAEKLRADPEVAAALAHGRSRVKGNEAKSSRLKIIRSA